MSSNAYKNWLESKAIELINPEGEIPIQYHIDVNELSKAEAEEMGFKQWNDDGLMLIPAKINHLLKAGTEVICIDGSNVILGDHDTDSRAGLLAYGIKPIN